MTSDTTASGASASTAQSAKDIPTQIINRHMIWSMAAGLVPFPVLDIAGVTAAQIKMVSELAKHYKVKDADAEQERLRGVIGGLIGSLTAMNIGRGIVGSALKSLPGIGTIAGLVAVPITAGASTYAVGKVFVMHFESGGTLLSFDPKKMKTFFSDFYKAGEQIAHDLKDKVTPNKS